MLHQPVHANTSVPLGKLLVALALWKVSHGVGDNALQGLQILVHLALDGTQHRVPSTVHLFNSSLGLHPGMQCFVLLRSAR